MLAVFVWDGEVDGGSTTSNGLWSTPANWVGDEAPAPGDYLHFPASATQLATTNDFAVNTPFAGLIFTGDGYTVTGAAIRLENGVVNEGLDNVLSLPLRLENSQVLVSTGTLRIDGAIDLQGNVATLDGSPGAALATASYGDSLVFAGPISGTGGILAAGTGVVRLTAANTFAGTVEVAGGRLVLANSNVYSGVTTIRNNAVLEVADNSGLGASSPPATAGVAVVGGGVIELSGGVTISGEAVTATAGLTIRASSGANTWTGEVSVTGTLVLDSIFPYGTVRLSGPVTAGEFESATSFGLLHELAGAMVVAGSATIAATDIIGTLQVGGDLNLSSSVVRSGATVTAANVVMTSTDVDGAVVSNGAMSAGNVSGDGSLEYAAGDFATLEPGDLLTTGLLGLGRPAAATTLAVYSPLIAGPAAVDYDRLSVRGTLHLADAVFEPVFNAYVPSVGQSFVLIENDGTDAVTGRFLALPEGGLLLVNNLVFALSYQAGDGNDIALQRVATFVWDGRPDGGGASANANWSIATNWVGDIAPGANSILLFPADAAAPRDSVNNFPADTAFRSVILTGSDYTLSGNSVQLTSGLINTGDDNTVSFATRLAQDQAFRSDGSLTYSGVLDLNGTNWTLDARSTLMPGLNVSGMVVGAGRIVKEGLGTAAMTAPANTFSGSLLVRSGMLDIASQNSFEGKTVLAGGGVVLRNNLALGVADSGPAAGIEVSQFGRITLDAGVTIANESVFGSGAVEMAALGGAALWSSSIAINGALTVDNQSTSGQLTFTAPITAKVHFSSGLGDQPNAYEGPVTVAEFCIHTGSMIRGSVQCGGNLFLQESVVAATGTASAAGSATLLTAHVDGLVQAAVRASGSVVSGNGVITMPTGVLEDVYPGTATSIGTLQVGTTTLGDFYPQITGTAGPGLAGGHDLLRVAGVMTLAGDLRLTIDVAAPISVGDRFLLINNDGADAIKGQFRGLPQGGLVTVANQVFQIDYSAGDGNDVEIKRVTASVWDGSPDGSGTASINANWTTGTNWVGDLPPAPNAILLFPSSAAFFASNTNNFTAGTAFDSIHVDGDGYSLSGNRVVLLNGLGNRGLGTEIGLPITLADAQTFSTVESATVSFHGTIDLGGQTLTLSSDNPDVDAFRVNGVVAGAGGIVKQGGGSVRLTAAANSFTGFVTAAGGELRLDGQNVYGGRTTISNDATITLANPEALGLADGTAETGVEIVESGTLAFASGILVANERIVGDGVVWMTARSGSSRWTGAIQVEQELFINNLGWTGDLGLDGAVTSPFIDAAWNGSQRNTIRGTVAANEMFAVGIDGTGSMAFASGRLDAIRPGTSVGTGILTVSGGQMLQQSARIGGLTAGDDYDQLVVEGPLDLTLATLSIDVIGGFEPARGDQFTIVAKSGTAPADGQYLGRPQGSLLLVNGHVFAIDYRGGDGNDIVLRTLSGDLPPTLILNPASSIEVNEGEIAARGGQFAAARAGQAITITASSGNVTQTGTEAGVWNWTAAAIDGPNDPINITIRATDPTGTYSEVSFDYRVLNVPPVITALSNSVASINCMRLLTPMTLTGAFTDAGLTDTHTALVDWGDGSQSMATITPTPGGGGGTLNATHRYLLAGKFTIKVTITDDDGGAVESTTTAYIAGGALVSGTLTIIGTCGGDLVTLARFPDGRTQLNARFCATGCATSWQQSSTYPANSITSIRMELGDGKDSATISELIRAPAFIDAGAGDDIITAGGGNDTILGGEGLDALNGGGGDDSLSGGNGNDSIFGGNGNDSLMGGAGDDRMFGAAGQDVLFGESGNDTLFGGTTCLDDPNNDILVGGEGRDTLCAGDGRDILVGGSGADNLQGNAGEDVVLGGTVIDDTDITQMATLLIAARAVWGSNLDYATRVNQIRNILRPGVNTWDDRAVDATRGEGGRDWFLGDRDAVLTDNDTYFDRATNESFDQLPDRP